MCPRSLHVSTIVRNRKQVVNNPGNSQKIHFCVAKNGTGSIRSPIAGRDREQAKQARIAANQRKKNIEIIDQDGIIRPKNGLPSRVDGLPDERLPYTQFREIEANKKLPEGLSALVPAGVDVTGVGVMAGGGTSTPIRDLRRLYETYGGFPDGWQKKFGTVYGKVFHYEIHWYQNGDILPEREMKIKGGGRNK